MDKIAMYKRGYDEGFRHKEKLSASMLENNVKQYMDGYAKGLEDKEFCDTYSDEAMGVEGYGP